MINRRQFLKGLLAMVAATAIERNGVLRPSAEIEQPTRTIFDMAANTWRHHLLIGPRGHVYCGCSLELLIGGEWLPLDCERARVDLSWLETPKEITIKGYYVTSDNCN